MFLPTLLECFSANYPEAMAMELPILTSDLDFAHSICHDAALFFNPTDPAQIAENIIKIVESQPLREDLIKKGKQNLSCFPTPSQKAKAYLSIISHSISNS